MRETKKSTDGDVRPAVWVRLNIEAQDAAFAETQWRKFGYFSRDDYLNALLNTALMREMDTAMNKSADESPEPFNPDNLGDDLPF